jgi:uncharacterized RDD family membrane protein YckC
LDKGGIVVTDELDEQSSPTPGGQTALKVLNFASLGDRLLAQAVDGLVAVGIFVFLGLTLASKFGGLTDQGFELTGAPALILMGVLLSVMLIYFILLEGFFGATLGKWVAEIRVAKREGGGIDMRASIIRNLMRLVDGIGVYLVGAFSVILTSRRVRLGDIAAGTVVLRRDTGRVARAGGLLAALLLALGGIWGGIALRDESAKTSGPVSATLALGASPNHEPINPTTTFSPDAPVIYVAFRASQVQPGSRLKAVWTVVNVGAVAPPNSQLAESTVVLPGAAPGSFRFTRGSQPWPVGDYKVDVYLNDQLALTLPYKIIR